MAIKTLVLPLHHRDPIETEPQNVKCIKWVICNSWIGFCFCGQTLFIPKKQGMIIIIIIIFSAILADLDPEWH